MKGMFLERKHIKGIAGGAKYVIGVPNPFTRRTRARLRTRHLWVLHVLLSFAPEDCTEKEFLVSRTGYADRFGGEDGWESLLELLDSWYRIQSTGYSVEGTVAETTVLNIAGRTGLRVRFGGPLVIAFKILLHQSGPKLSDSSTLAKTQVDQALSNLHLPNPDQTI
jgi:hypothetical protein